MKKRNKNLLIYVFKSMGHGEVIVKQYSPREDLTMTHVRAEAERLIATYTTKKGVRLERFLYAYRYRREFRPVS